jgi:hypothetical protein
MVSKIPYSIERFQNAALLAEEKARDSWPLKVSKGEHPVEIKCDFVGLAETGGAKVEGAAVKWNTMLAFRWHARCKGSVGDTPLDETMVVAVRCDHACKRGVPFPDAWQQALRGLSLQSMAISSEQKVQERCGLTNIRCRVAGQPKHSPLPNADIQNEPGAIAILTGAGGANVEHLLCALVSENRWLCHRGSFCAGQLDEGEPFKPRDLLIKDLHRDRPCAGEPPQRKRISAHLHAGMLRSLAAARPEEWNFIVAVAKWKVEETTATLEQRPLDEARGLCDFESSPWKWEARSGARSHTLITSLWSWRCPDVWQHRFVSVRLSNLYQREAIPQPPELWKGHELLWDSLERVAAQTSADYKAPCVYVGLVVGPDRFEPNPDRWPSRCFPASLGKTMATVHFEWQGVLVGSQAHRVGITVHNALRIGVRNIPRNPLLQSAGSHLTFSIDFMDKLAARVHPGVEFKGIAFEGDRPQIVRQLPRGGVDIQDDPVYWTLPNGSCVCWSAKKLAMQLPSAFAAQSNERYHAVAKELGYDVLGTTNDEESLQTFCSSPGSLKERLWTRCSWRKPMDETCPCWWVANAASMDRQQKTKLVCRSLVGLSLEMNQGRIATTSKLRREWERRLEDNGRAVDVLESNQHLWKHVGGPRPHSLYEPSKTMVEAAQTAAKALSRMIEAHVGLDKDGLDVFVHEILRAVSALRVVSWDAIRRERFSLTPEALFGELARSAQTALASREEEARRRQARILASAAGNEMEEEDDEEEAEEEAEEKHHPGDACASDRPAGETSKKKEWMRNHIDLDAFKNKSLRRPHGWQRAVSIAGELHIDEMRTLLELHYDEVHLLAWNSKQNAGSERKAPPRGSQFKVFGSAVQAHRQRLNLHVELPPTVKGILRQPQDERSWEKLEQLRNAIVDEALGHMEIDLETEEEIGLIASALECNDGGLPDQVGERPATKVPKLARVLLDKSNLVPEADLGTEEEIRLIAATLEGNDVGLPDQVGERPATEVPKLAHVLLNRAKLGDPKQMRSRALAGVRALAPGSTLSIELRPMGDKRTEPPLDAFGKDLAHHPEKSVKIIAGDHHLLTAAEAFDRLMLVLWDVRFLQMCIRWSASGVSNLPADEALELGRYFLWGQAVGSKALFDGICAQCGTLLHGALNQNSALSNKCTGPPSNRDGKALFDDDGAPVTSAQPPFLLRYSPKLFAKDAPSVFVYDEETNRLSLQEGIKREPWRRATDAGGPNTWLYCRDCKERWFPDPGQRMHSHVPFRDRASQNLMKPVARKGKPKQPRAYSKSTFAEPEGEPSPEEEGRAEEPLANEESFSPAEDSSPAQSNPKSKSPNWQNPDHFSFYVLRFFTFHRAGTPLCGEMAYRNGGS